MNTAHLLALVVLGLLVWFVVKPASQSVRLLGSAILAGLLVGWLAVAAGW